MNRVILSAAFGAALLFPGLALAQSSSGAQNQTNPPANSSQGNAAANANSSNPAYLTGNRVKQDLEKAGFTDVKIVESAFVVQAKSKDGDPITMFIGPHGFSAVESVNPSGSGVKSPNNAAPSGSSTNK